MSVESKPNRIIHNVNHSNNEASNSRKQKFKELTSISNSNKL